MDNLESAIIALFRHVPAKKIITGEIDATDIKRGDFVRLMRSEPGRYSETELENLYHYLSGKFIEEFHGAECRRDGKETLDVFALLRYYAGEILTEQDGELVCEYSQFLHWRKVTEALSEDLFTVSYMASRRKEQASRTVRFDWKAVLTHNNWELHKILEQGMAENHAHLKGSSPIFHLNWISMMNDPYLEGREGEIDRMERKRRNITRNAFSPDQEESLRVQLLLAAGIRYLLFWVAWFMPQGEKPSEELVQCCAALNNSISIYAMKHGLSVEIASKRNALSRELSQDYALAGVLGENRELDDRTVIFQGERWLLYHYFLSIFQKSELYPYRNLFYAYLVIKENIRSEYVQNNKYVGFENFSIYEGRKDVFLENPFFKKELVRKAVEASFAESRAVVMEARIAPKKSAVEYCKNIREWDECFFDKDIYKHRLFYIVHFIKAPEQVTNYEFITYRHRKKRSEYRNQALCLAQFREEYPQEAERVRGIDAANTEIGCGPEVFAHVFRYLSDHKSFFGSERKCKVPQLKKTCHVGEDFLDLVSGLRAIDEAIHFLEMKCGDRLGHAIALGIDAEEWYHGKNNRILLTQQEYLDNVAWLYHMAVSCHMNDRENVLNYLKKEYEYYFQIIYRNAMDQKRLEHINQKAQEYYKDTEWEKYYHDRKYDFSIENYYLAWQLRGDAPELYRDGYFENREVAEYRHISFAYYSISRGFPKEQSNRYLQEIALQYHYYHYNGYVRREGDKRIEKTIERPYINCVRMIQRELQKKVALCGIGIEANPSSNVLIGTFQRYDKHPILNFYNKGLVEEGEKLKECPQLNVSINTDDAGIFSTSLENEYAYMALALEKTKDEYGNRLYKKKNVYEWLDHVRIMGLRQTFLGEEEMKKAVEAWRGDRQKKAGVEE